MESMTQHASQSNQFVFGGLVLIIVQSLSRLLESSLYYIATGVFRLIFVTVDVDNSQVLFFCERFYASSMFLLKRILIRGSFLICRICILKDR